MMVKSIGRQVHELSRDPVTLVRFGRVPADC